MHPRQHTFLTHRTHSHDLSATQTDNRNERFAPTHNPDNEAALTQTFAQTQNAGGGFLQSDCFLIFATRSFEVLPFCLLQRSRPLSPGLSRIFSNFPRTQRGRKGKQTIEQT